jgi:hypothetical protein
LLLGACLQSEGYDDITYVSGERGNSSDGSWTSHAWLEVGDIVVDVTAGQFQEISTDWVISRKSFWHQSFKVQGRMPVEEQLTNAPPYLRELKQKLFSRL